MKDEPLWALALVTDRRVLSNDAAQRTLLRGLVPDVSPLGDVAWVTASHPDTVPWLTSGAPITAPHRVIDPA